MTYHRLLEIYAEEAGLPKRVIIPVPVLTPTLSAYWIRFISPVPTAIALPLTEGLTSDAVCRDNGDTLWQPRGLIDRIFGGRGIAAARPRRSELRAGDTLDFWRVLQADPPHHLQLLSEIKAPDDALLDFRISPLGQSRCELQISSRFLPKGLGGISYWYAFYAFHHIIFRGMLTGIVRAAGKHLIWGPERWLPPEKDVCFLPKY
jgi:hypothetical protein